MCIIYYIKAYTVYGTDNLYTGFNKTGFDK